MTQRIDLQFHPQTRVPFQLCKSPRQDMVAKFTVPAEAKGTFFVALYEHGSAPFKCAFKASKQDNDFGTTAQISEQTYHFQVGGQADPASAAIVVQPGETWYVSATRNYNDKMGEGAETVYSCAVELGGVAW